MAEGLIAGNRPDALPASINELETPLRVGTEPPLRVGTGPSGRTVSAGALAVGLAAEAGAAMTATLSPAAGGVHFAEVTMLAVAVSVTDLTEVASAATGT